MPTRKKTMLYTHAIGEALKAWRLEWQLTQDELAQRCGYGKGYLSRVENGVISQPDDEHLLRMADALVIPIKYLRDRILPDDLSLQERKELEEKWKSDEEDKKNGKSVLQPAPALAQSEEQSESAVADARVAFTLRGPPRQVRQNEEEALFQEVLAITEELRKEEVQLRQRLAHIEKLRTKLEKFLAQRGKA